MAGNTGLYDPSFEHDACGIGFVANIKGHKSHQHITDALTVLENMEHRGACGCENNTGDGAGIMIQTPHEFFFDECLKLGVHLPVFGKYGAGMIFFPKEIRLREECRDIFNRSAEKIGLEILAYRKVPVNTSGIGPTALSVEPEIEQELKDVHHLAFGIRDLVVALADKASAASPASAARLKGLVGQVKASASKLDELGDAGNLSGTQAEYAKLNTILDAIKTVAGAE